jgi:signal transduction histidine kinase
VSAGAPSFNAPTTAPLDPRAYQAAFQLSTEATAFLDASRDIVAMNQSFAQLFGEEVRTGEPFSTLFPAEEAPRVEGVLRVAQQWSEAAAAAVRTTKGPIDLRASAFVTDEGERLLLVGARSATTRLEAERLHEAAVLAARACNAATTWEELSAGAEATASRVLRQATGFARLRRVGDAWTVARASGALSAWARDGGSAGPLWTRFAGEGESVLIADIEVELKDEHAGLARDVDAASLVVSPIPGTEGVSGFLVASAGAVAAFTLHDVRCLEAVTREMASASARLEAHEALTVSLAQLRLAFEENNELLARVSRLNTELEDFALWTTHDLREPLRGLATLAAYVAQEVGEDPSSAPVDDLARQLEASSTRLKEHIRNLHEFHEMARDTTHREDIQLRELVDRAREDDATSGARFILTDPDARLLVDPARITRAIADMVRYAADKAATPLVIKVETDIGAATFSIPLASEPTGRAAEAAFHVVGERNSLALARRIALQHGGSLGFERRSQPLLVLCLPRLRGTHPQIPF